MPARRIVCWLTCQGSRVRGSPGTKEPKPPGVSGKDPHLRSAQLIAVFADRPATEHVDRRDQKQVQQQFSGESPQNELPEGRGLTDQEADEQPAQLVENRDDGNREEGCVRPVASGRLAIATGPEACKREQQ